MSRLTRPGRLFLAAGLLAVLAGLAPSARAQGQRRAFRLGTHALRFILHHPAVSTVIPGMRKAGHVERNLAAGSEPRLEPALITALRAHRWERDWKVS